MKINNFNAISKIFILVVFGLGSFAATASESIIGCVCATRYVFKYPSNYWYSELQIIYKNEVTGKLETATTSTFIDIDQHGENGCETQLNKISACVQSQVKKEDVPTT